MDKKMKNMKCIKYIILGIAVVGLIVIIFYNMYVDISTFLTANITSVMSIGAVLFFSYYLTQMKNDERKTKDNIERLLVKIQTELSSSKLIQNDNNMCLLYQKSVANKIEYLKSLDIKSIKTDLDYISEQFHTLRELFGTHMNDEKFPDSMEKDFQRIIVNITDRCDMMLIKLRV